MQTQVLPRPCLSWDDVYQILVDLAETGGCTEDIAVSVLSLVAGMQGGEPVDPWVLESLLGLAGIDMDNVDEVAMTAAIAIRFQGAGLLPIEHDLGCWLGHFQDSDGASRAFRYRELIRLEVLHRLWEIEARAAAHRPLEG